MEKRTMEKRGVTTSLLGFGCMRFPLGDDGKIDQAVAKAMMLDAYRSGVNYFDTAYAYHDGQSESFTGEVLDELPRESFYLATKLPIWLLKKTSDVRRIFEIQLSRLKKDYVDFYLLHALNKNLWNKTLSLGILEECQKLKKEGKIRHLGFSFHDSYDVFEQIIKAAEWDFCQIQLNYMDIEVQAGIKGYELATSRGIPVIVMEPVKGGSLARLPDDIYALFNEVNPGASPSSWALRWAGSLPNVKVVLSGMSTPEQVSENVKTFEHFVPLSEKEHDVVHAVSDLFKKRIRNACTACGYCMPCPVKVNIPENFKLWNEYAMFENVGHTRWWWKESLPASAKPEHCIECGQCEAACPQSISIIDDLKALQMEIEKVIT